MVTLILVAVAAALVVALIRLRQALGLERDRRRAAEVRADVMKAAYRSAQENAEHAFRLWARSTSSSDITRVWAAHGGEVEEVAS